MKCEYKKGCSYECPDKVPQCLYKRMYERNLAFLKEVQEVNQRKPFKKDGLLLKIDKEEK